MIFTLSSPEQRPLVVGVIALSKSGEAAASYNLVFAGTVISLIPVLVAYTVGNKYFVSGSCRRCGKRIIPTIKIY